MTTETYFIAMQDDDSFEGKTLNISTQYSAEFIETVKRLADTTKNIEIYQMKRYHFADINVDTLLPYY